jgi:nitrogen regulatory protein PII
LGQIENVRSEIGVSDHYESRAVDAIVRSARTGEVGDGKIFITEVGHVVRIRSGERGMDAVTPLHPGAHALSYTNA